MNPHLQISQRLYAQCQRCFMLQGSAVRTNTHVLAYHNHFRFSHLAPALALLVIDRNPAIKRFYKSLAEDLYRSDKDIDRLATDVSKLRDRFR
jgi:hypothetical protein